MPPIGHQIYKMRLERGMTQEQLAQKAGLPQPNLSNIEKGRQDITISTLRRIAYGLGVDLVDFFQSERRGKHRTSLSFGRPVLERVARAIATNEPSRLSRREQKISALFQNLIPELQKGRLNVKRMNQSWLQLKKELNSSAIASVMNRVRDVWSRRK